MRPPTVQRRVDSHVGSGAYPYRRRPMLVRAEREVVVEGICAEARRCPGAAGGGEAGEQPRMPAWTQTHGKTSIQAAMEDVARARWCLGTAVCERWSCSECDYSTGRRYDLPSSSLRYGRQLGASKSICAPPPPTTLAAESVSVCHA